MTPELRITTKHGIEIGTIQPVIEHEGWFNSRFTPSLCFNSIESLFYHRNDAIDNQLLTHEDMLSDAIRALGLSIDDAELADLFVWPDGRCLYRFTPMAHSQETANRRNSSPSLSLTKRIA